MTDTFPPISLQHAFQIWSRTSDISVPSILTGEEHITTTELLKLTKPNGLQTANEEVRHHLSHCSVCLDNWFAACGEQGKKDGLLADGASDDWYSGGLLEAAAGGGVSSALQLQSSCGHFRLCLYPDVDKPGWGMVTLEYLGTADSDPEGRSVTIKDRQGVTVLEGVVQRGRLARLSEQFNSIDLQSWSLRLHGATSGQQDG